MAMRFPAKKNAGCAKVPREFPPWETPPPPPESVFTGVRTSERWRQNQNFSHRYRAPDFLTHGDPLRALGALDLHY